MLKANVLKILRDHGGSVRSISHLKQKLMESGVLYNTRTFYRRLKKMNASGEINIAEKSEEKEKAYRARKVSITTRGEEFFEYYSSIFLKQRG